MSQKHRHEFTGTPSEIGSQIFEKFCNPAIVEVSRKHPAQLHLLYTGFLSGMVGSLVADFGRGSTMFLLEKTLEMLKEELQSIDGTYERVEE